MNRFKLITVGLLALALHWSPAAQAFGVSVSPTSIQLDGRTLFGHIEVSNTSEQSKVFAVEFSSPEQAACFKVSPKLVSIPEGASQMVRFQYTCPQIPVGEMPLVYLTDMAGPRTPVIQQNQLDFRLRLGLKVKLQTNSLQTLF